MFFFLPRLCPRLPGVSRWLHWGWYLVHGVHREGSRPRPQRLHWGMQGGTVPGTQDLQRFEMKSFMSPFIMSPCPLRSSIYSMYLCIIYRFTNVHISIHLIIGNQSFSLLHTMGRSLLFKLSKSNNFNSKFTKI